MSKTKKVLFRELSKKDFTPKWKGSNVKLNLGHKEILLTIESSKIHECDQLAIASGLIEAAFTSVLMLDTIRVVPRVYLRSRQVTYMLTVEMWAFFPFQWEEQSMEKSNRTAHEKQSRKNLSAKFLIRDSLLTNFFLVFQTGLPSWTTRWIFLLMLI